MRQSTSSNTNGRPVSVAHTVAAVVCSKISTWSTTELFVPCCEVILGCNEVFGNRSYLTVLLSPLIVYASRKKKKRDWLHMSHTKFFVLMCCNYRCFICCVVYCCRSSGRAVWDAGIDRSYTGSRVRIPPKAWMFVLVFPCCAVLWR
jgi:hypothetical protein